jgi:hypothetical protein
MLRGLCAISNAPQPLKPVLNPILSVVSMHPAARGELWTILADSAHQSDRCCLQFFQLTPCAARGLNSEYENKPSSPSPREGAAHLGLCRGCLRRDSRVWSWPLACHPDQSHDCGADCPFPIAGGDFGRRDDRSPLTFESISRLTPKQCSSTHGWTRLSRRPLFMRRVFAKW